MTPLDAQKLVEKAGTRITREKLIEALRRSTERDFSFFKEPQGPFTLIRVKLS